MTLPPCALCGESLSVRTRAALERGRVLLSFRTGPRVGWHSDCAMRDMLYQRHMRRRDQSGALERLRAALAVRAAGLVVARRKEP